MRGTWISHVPVYTGFHHFCGDYLPSMSYRALAIHWYLSCEAQQCTACVSWQLYQWIMQESTLRIASEVQCLLTLQLVNWTCGCAWLSLLKWICPKWNRGGNIYLFFTFSPSLCCVISQCVFLSLKQNKHKHTKNYPRPPLSPAPFFALLSLFAAPLQLLLWTAVARQQLIEQEGYAIDQLEIFQMKSGVKSSRSYN